MMPIKKRALFLCMLLAGSRAFVIATEMELQGPEGVEKYGYRNVDNVDNAAASLVMGQVWVEDGEEDCDNSDDSDDGSQWHFKDPAPEPDDDDDDCDNGDDSDDGSQWHLKDVESAPEPEEEEEDDCDNGDDSDDGSQWHLKDVESAPEPDEEEDDCDNGDDSDDGSQWHLKDVELAPEPEEEDDCDNGDDSDDGSQWHLNDPETDSNSRFSEVIAEENLDCDEPEWQVKQEDLDPSSGFQRPVRTRFSRTTAQGLTPFPQWLTDITNMTQWPGHEVSFFAQPGIDLSNIPNVPLRQLGDCSQITLDHCSFDCFRCTSPDEVMSCPVLSQTFDDGPSPATPKLLDQLPGKTTFFTQGINVIRFPDTFRQQHAQGHLLASHTWSHANLAGVSNEQVAAQIQWSVWAMNATAGIVPRFFRPPYGASDNRVRAIARQFGLVSVFWDRDTFDWQVNDKKKVPAQILEEVKGWKDDSVSGLILEHDSTIDTVNVGVDVSRLLGVKQYTVAECVDGKWYQNL